MRILYVSIQLRFLITLTALLVVSVVVLCVASSVMTGNILIDMKETSLNITSMHIYTAIERLMMGAFLQALRVSLSTNVQNIVGGSPDSMSYDQRRVLSEALGSADIVYLRMYAGNLTAMGDVSFLNVTNSSLFTNDSFFPLESEPEQILPETIKLGMNAVGPRPYKIFANQSTYLWSITIPILEADDVTTVLSAPADIANSQAPIVGFLTCLVDCTSWHSTTISTDIFAVLGRFSGDAMYTVLPLTVLSAPAMGGYAYNRSYVMESSAVSKVNGSTGPVVIQGGAISAVGTTGIVSLVEFKEPALANYLVVVRESTSGGLGRTTHSLTQALWICALVAVVVGFLVLLLVNRWRTNNLVSLIISTGKRKKALDESRKRVNASNILDGPDGSDDGAGGTKRNSFLAANSTAGGTQNNAPDDPKCGARNPTPGGASADTMADTSREMDPSPHSLTTDPSSTLSMDEYYKHEKKPEGKPTLPWLFGHGKNKSFDIDPEPQSHSQSLQKTLRLGPLIKDETTDMSLRIDSIFEALIRQYKVLEYRVEGRKQQIAEAKRAADDANAAKSHFLARVTHELRTPLNGILGTASLCLDEEDLPQIHSSLKTIYKCGELLLHLLTDLLNFSQSESENVELDEQEFMINEVTTQILAIFREQTEKGHIKLDMNIDPACKNLIVYGDLNRILQIIFNLLSNSLKFTPEGGKVEFVIKTEKRDHDTKRLVTFIVRDNGPGIAPHLQSRVFEAFVQGDINNKVRKAGVGLGLSICRQLAKRMGGSISLKSELGHGAEFTFNVTLRICSVVLDGPPTTPGKDGSLWPEYEHYNTSTIMRKAEAELGVSRKLSSSTTPSIANASFGQSIDFHRSTTSSSGNEDRFDSSSSERGSIRPPLDRGLSMKGSTVDTNLRVLVADDNKVNQEVMIRMLNLEGLKNIIVADDGLEAIEQTKGALERDELFDIIFMDVQMPNCDGKRATKVLREMGLKLPIVAVSAYANEENVEACLQAGMSLFLGKPLRRPSLHKLLQELQDL